MCVWCNYIVAIDYRISNSRENIFRGKFEIPATYKQATITIPVLRTPVHPRIPFGVRILFSNGNIIPMPSKVNIAKKAI